MRKCRPCEACIDIALAIGDHHHRGSLGQLRCRTLRPFQPTDALLVFQRAAVCRGDLVRTCPYPGTQQTENGACLAVDGDLRMDEEPGGNAVPCRPESTAPLLAAGEIDLGGVLRHDDPAPSAGGSGAACQGLHDLDGCDRRRRQEAMDRNLTRAIKAKPADDQRPGFHHPFDQCAAHCRPTSIPKMTKCSNLPPHDIPK